MLTLLYHSTSIALEI
uniref:Uncharacterized protein n=1 Tax=Anguilla anguilla TaxID=7936 RepID=A0A0E9T2Z4_ANGAN